MVSGEMMVGDKAAKPVQPLAVVENRQLSRSMGGCVGIFFQLFDWHRRFAKKKLFSRKLIPPARPKQVMRDFKRGEKMPVAKLHHIADENKGGFPDSRKTKNNGVERRPEVGSLGVVARLMGLDSMPSMGGDKVSCGTKASKSATINKGLVRENACWGKGHLRQERPHKLQKTGPSESRAVTRFGAEALQIKGVSSRPKKQSNSKVASPVKSTRVSSSRNGSHRSRLVGAATKILEPGLQAKSMKKGALTCYASGDRDSGDGVVSKSLAMEGNPYISYNHMLNETTMCSYSEDQGMRLSHSSSSSGFPDVTYRDSIRNKRTPLVPTVDKGMIFCKKQREFINLKDGRRLTSDCQEPWHFPSKKSASQRDESSPVARPKSKRVFPAARYVSSGQPRPEILNKAESSRIVAVRRSPRQRDSISPLRTPIRSVRTPNSNESVRSANTHNPVKRKQRKVTSVADTGNGKGSDKSSVISFTFDSLRKQNIISSKEDEDRIFKKSLSVRDNDVAEITASEGSTNSTCFQDNLTVRGDALGAILEQKLKELMSPEDDDLANESTKPKRTTATILQELIVALTTDPAESRDCDMLDNNKTFQVKPVKEEAPNVIPCDANHLSLGSVLDTAFMNDSRVSSSSMDDSSGLNLLTDFVDFSWGLPQLLEPDCDIQESPLMLEEGKAHPDTVINAIGCRNRPLNQLYLSDIRLPGSKLSCAKQVILHSEMLFSGPEDAIISSSLLDELESIAFSEWMSTGWLDGIVDLKEGTQLKELLFDCLLECLELKYRPCSSFGYQRWTRLPSQLNVKILVRDVEGELKKWAGLVGMSVDEMIEWEMSHSLGKWVDFDIEAFENGCEIQKDILHNLMEEILDDMSHGSFSSVHQPRPLNMDPVDRRF
ncbi:hypothetical protein SAY86_004428 [Trapa natans]|uniref:DUF4378 domain-containing protein n=1 Tax=Trapa natans TaxID=22666 RepID=A0AAN7MIJ0_TRANT|nr:hypothetical protein SAY86_004428 [Trapa natans]